MIPRPRTPGRRSSTRIWWTCRAWRGGDQKILNLIWERIRGGGASRRQFRQNLTTVNGGNLVMLHKKLDILPGLGDYVCEKRCRIHLLHTGSQLKITCRDLEEQRRALAKRSLSLVVRETVIWPCVAAACSSVERRSPLFFFRRAKCAHLDYRGSESVNGEPGDEEDAAQRTGPAAGCKRWWLFGYIITYPPLLLFQELVLSNLVQLISSYWAMSIISKQSLLIMCGIMSNLNIVKTLSLWALWLLMSHDRKRHQISTSGYHHPLLFSSIMTSYKASKKVCSIFWFFCWININHD